MSGAIFFLVGAVAGLWLSPRIRSWWRRRRADEAIPSRQEQLVTTSQEVAAVLEIGGKPADLVEHPAFRRGVDLLDDAGVPTVDLLAYAAGSNEAMACLALEALSRRPEAYGKVRSDVLELLTRWHDWIKYFAFRTVCAHDADPAVAVLAHIDDDWAEQPLVSVLTEFLKECDKISIVDHQPQLSVSQLDELTPVVAKLPDELREKLVPQLEAIRADRVDTQYLQSVGRLNPSDLDSIVSHPALAQQVETIVRELSGEPRRSVLVTGEHGVGKTTLIRAAADALKAEGWKVFESRAQDVLAGQSYIGQLEERVKKLLEEVGRDRLLWIIFDFHELLWAGRHRFSAVSVLDMLLQPIEQSQVSILGESADASYQLLARSKPKVRVAMSTCRVLPLDPEATWELARKWCDTALEQGRLGPVDERVLTEAMALSQQYLGQRSSPGAILSLLTAVVQEGGGRGTGSPVEPEDLLGALSHVTGLPVDVLDQREPLDLAGVREFFCERIMGQDEAIDCLVERIAMVKAGLTDPSRPQGVFLFAGPTGTGKTEIAKALSEYLFGSDEHMIRLDMSEFTTAESLSRIVGEQDEAGTGKALVHQIRNEPFSVVLLDEFEKANASVWDLFLQVFDDGRLTDRMGAVADFRHCIIVLTSNLGSVIPRGSTIGFESAGGGFSEAAVHKAIGKSFRPEFINRLDRVVVFHPLDRSVMRRILKKELDAIVQRRGLRNRQWALEWDESAMEFLLQKGFTSDLGARPLKRAIERYLLAPLAEVIASHSYPEGEQFLFVRSNFSAIQVEFVDPDASTIDDQPGPVTTPFDGELTLRRVLLTPAGQPSEFSYLTTRFDEIRQLPESQPWKDRKQEALDKMTEPDFWMKTDRLAVLSTIEYMDRIEAGLETARSLMNRLKAGSGKSGYSRELTGRVAQQLYLLEAACKALVESRPLDAFVLVDSGPGPEAAEEVKSIVGMYKGWAGKRRMRLSVLEPAGSEVDPPTILAISGFGAYLLLENESGLHVFESARRGRRSLQRRTVRVQVEAEPEEAGASDPAGRRQRALQQFKKESSETRIVRRYVTEPSPQVRDQVSGWKTGKLDRVLSGDFDLFEPSTG